MCQQNGHCGIVQTSRTMESNKSKPCFSPSYSSHHKQHVSRTGQTDRPLCSFPRHPMVLQLRWPPRAQRSGFHPAARAEITNTEDERTKD
jgi:hypothetical protein